MAEMAKKFGYSEPLTGILGERTCQDCAHTIGGDGCRHFGVMKGLTLGDPNYGKVVAHCSLQDAYVKPYGRCVEFKGGIAIGDGVK